MRHKSRKNADARPDYPHSTIAETGGVYYKMYAGYTGLTRCGPDRDHESIDTGLLRIGGGPSCDAAVLDRDHDIDSRDAHEKPPCLPGFGERRGEFC